MKNRELDKLKERINKMGHDEVIGLVGVVEARAKSLGMERLSGVLQNGPGAALHDMVRLRKPNTPPQLPVPPQN